MPNEPTCKVCGYSYALGNREDEERHGQFHDEEENGPRSDMNDGLYVVSLEDTLILQSIAEHSFRVGMRETSYEFPLFTAGEQSKNHPIAVIEIKCGRTIAGVLTRIRLCERRTTLENFVVNASDGCWNPNCGEIIMSHERRAIEFIWVHKRFRGGQVLDGCLTKLSQYIGLPISQLSHSLPFTETAFRFWRKRSLNRIYIANYGFDLPEDWPYSKIVNDGIDLLRKGNI
jgi:hypothetical protein